jgi:hypothetical protein
MSTAPPIRLVPRPSTLSDVVGVLERHADTLERHGGRISLLVEAEGATATALGQVAVELANLRRTDDELRRVIIERGSIPPVRPAMDTGSYALVEAYGALKEAAADARHPMTSDRVRAIAANVRDEMRAATELTTWRRIKAMPAWAARKAAEKAIEWLIPLILGGVAVEVWRLLHK